MLGSLKKNRQWSWAAYGKHPSAKDYFCINHESPLVKIFADWVEKGYNELAAKKKSDNNPVAWRFWAGGQGKENLICGLVKDSSDSLGRHYPLLIIGTGQCKGWEAHWDLLPFACEKPWGELEYLSAQVFGDFNTMGVEIQSIRPPRTDWSEFDIKRKNIIDAEASLHDIESRAKDLSDKNEVIICLDLKNTGDQFLLISSWHALFKRFNRKIPNAVFMGGTFERSYVAFFNRPLMTVDFVRLWSISSAGVRENGSLVIG
jgi:type VI secretion system protein VasJ